VLRIEVDGFMPTPEELAAIALDGYSHFTAMQVRNLRVRGLDLHLKRLTSAHLELFGTELDGDLVRSHVRHALGSALDASVRVYLRQAEDRPSIMVTVRDPGDMPGGGQPWRLQSVPYQRSVAHIKRFNDFGQTYFRRRVQQDGFDEALLTGPGGLVCEGSLCNVGFIDGSRIIWPNAPMLTGTTMQLINVKFGGAGIEPTRQEVRLSGIGEFGGAFVCNARGIALVGQIDDIEMPLDSRWMTMITKVYESVEWDRI
jgi:branched-subunit amino acid aminotransferase/4-amino-4-deoxychorismate lyase